MGLLIDNEPGDSLLTDARRAVWSAVRAWPGLRSPENPDRSLFRGQFDFETDTPLAGFVPDVADMPALVIVPSGSVSPAFETNVAQEWPYALELAAWLPGWRVADAERLAFRMARAVCRATPSGSTVPFVKAATGLEPRLGSLSIVTPTVLDAEAEENAERDAVTLARLTVILRTRFKP